MGEGHSETRVQVIESANPTQFQHSYNWRAAFISLNQKVRGSPHIQFVFTYHAKAKLPCRYCWKEAITKLPRHFCFDQAPNKKYEVGEKREGNENLNQRKQSPHQKE
jgi:hypothetical protein